MKREYTNIIRFIIDELIPPIIRDSRWFIYPLFFAIYGKKAKEKMQFKSKILKEKNAIFFEDEIYAISKNRDSDLTQKTIKIIIDNIKNENGSIADIGCGKGFLLEKIREVNKDAKLFAIDVEEPKISIEKTLKFAADATKLPFENDFFDVTISTHTIEHILMPHKAFAELIRVSKKKLIIVVPRQRPYYHTLDSHVNFFVNEIDLLRYLPFEKFSLEVIDGDFVYIGEKNF